MPDEKRSNRNIIIAIIIILIVILLLLGRCLTKKPSPPPPPATTSTPAPTPAAKDAPTPAPAAQQPDEVLGPATITAGPRVAAGSAFKLAWTGPDNKGDFVTIVPKGAPDQAYDAYQLTEKGPSLDLTAPMDPGPHELRYVTGRSKTVLARVEIEVAPVEASLESPAEVARGSMFSVAWMGPNNKGDYVTITPKDSPDAAYGSYVNTEKGSPLTLTAPMELGDAEVRYVAGDGRKVLARRTIKVVNVQVSLTAPAEAIAGSRIDIAWTGPNNTGDYVTIVPKGVPDSQYGDYKNTSSGTPLKLLMPILAGDGELRYVSGQGGEVLARRDIKLTMPPITLTAPPTCAPEADVSITWTGPNFSGDYITIVPKNTPDGQYAAYTNTTAGSPLKVKAPKAAGDAEIRYCSGQGNKVMARVPIRVGP